MSIDNNNNKFQILSRAPRINDDKSEDKIKIII